MKEFKNWLLKNIDIKLLSLFFAIILWLYIAGGEKEFYRYISYPK